VGIRAPVRRAHRFRTSGFFYTFFRAFSRLFPACRRPARIPDRADGGILIAWNRAGEPAGNPPW